MAAAYLTTMKRISFSFYFLVFLSCFATLTSANRQLDESNWRDILEDEWMVEFYAPWCPACNALSPAWKEMGKKASKEYPKLRTAEVDVTQSPGLSGRFVVTALPTIFHVKDGEFRQYKGPRDATSMLDFVIQKRWKQTDPIPGWKAPNSVQMTLVAEFFKLSQALRSVHTTLMETYGLPTWGSYLIFAIATIFIGALLGLLLVCIIDLLYPPKRAAQKILLSRSEVEQLTKGDLDGKERSDDDDEMLNEDIVDDNEEQDSDGEKNSPPDTEEDDKVPTKESGDAGTENVTRRRRPRKDD